MTLYPHTNVCDLLQQLPIAAGILNKMGVPDAAIIRCDTLGEIAEIAKLDLSELQAAMAHLVGVAYEQENFAGIDGIGHLLERLRFEHHQILTQNLPQISDLMKEMSRHRDQNSIVWDELHLSFAQYRASISEHILREQDELFPYIEQLLLVRSQDLAPGIEEEQLLRNGESLCRILEMDEESDFLNEIEMHLADGAPRYSDMVRTRLRHQIEELRYRTEQHESLETDYLLPLVLCLESEVFRCLKVH
jgi:iron-sulfur cluster repair protein YtfE (RIC family)